MDTIGRMVADIGEHMFQISLRIDAIELAVADERVHGCCAHAATVRASVVAMTPTGKRTD